MKHAIFSIHPFSSETEALEELLRLGLEHPYFLEENSLHQIGGFFTLLPKELTHSSLHSLSQEIDWHEQWALHSPYYKNGLLEINLNDFGAHLEDPFIYLTPGPGFGDLSHPTTKLMLQAMISLVPGKVVLDIGCGSGILSLAAKKLGATRVIGLDIDQAAITHSLQNASLNQMPELAFVQNLPETLSGDLCVLINMTLQEQLTVFTSYPSLQGTFITSGILDNQKVRYKNLFPYPHSTITYHSLQEWASFVLN